MIRLLLNLFFPVPTAPPGVQVVGSRPQTVEPAHAEVTPCTAPSALFSCECHGVDDCPSEAFGRSRAVLAHHEARLLRAFGEVQP
jgi:hypothetical protein